MCLYVVYVHITRVWSLCALVQVNASFLSLFFFCHAGQTESPDQGPTSPRDALPQCTQHVRASCLHLLSTVTALVMWQGTSDAEHVLVVSSSGEKGGRMEEKQWVKKWKYPCINPTEGGLCPQSGLCQELGNISTCWQQTVPTRPFNACFQSFLNCGLLASK